MKDEELVIRAYRGVEQYEMIPTHALENDFPRTLVDNYVHWIHCGSMAIEWRPLERKWSPSPDNWRISTPEDSPTLSLGNKSLVDPQSLTAKAVHEWLMPLENSANINIYFNGDYGETQIRLPRMNLDFILLKDGLESKQFRGMIIDPIQAIGTLYGLQQKLVLKPKTGPSRIVIVPQGSISFHKTENQYAPTNLYK